MWHYPPHIQYVLSSISLIYSVQYYRHYLLHLLLSCIIVSTGHYLPYLLLSGDIVPTGHYLPYIQYRVSSMWYYLYGVFTCIYYFLPSSIQHLPIFSDQYALQYKLSPPNLYTLQYKLSPPNLYTLQYKLSPPNLCTL